MWEVEKKGLFFVFLLRQKNPRNCRIFAFVGFFFGNLVCMFFMYFFWKLGLSGDVDSGEVTFQQGVTGMGRSGR